MPTIQNRRATAAQWTAVNPVLAAGEIGFELDTNALKVGDGLTPWKTLPYLSDESLSELVETGRLSEAVLNDTYGPRVAPSTLGPYLASLPPYTGGELRRVVVKPGTYTITSAIRPPSGVVIDATACRFISEVPGNGGSLLNIENATDVEIIGGMWDGNRDWFTATTEHRHSVRIAGSRRITLAGLAAANAKGDGVYVGIDANPCADITLTKVRCKGNARNGLALVAVRHFSATDCVFEETSGIHPMSGLDIEPNLSTTVVDDIQFVNCAFRNNAQYGLMVSSPHAAEVRQGGITFTNCSITGNGGNESPNGEFGARLHNAREVKFIGGQITDNRKEGVYFSGSPLVSEGITFLGIEISRNGYEGIRAAHANARLLLSDVTLKDNGKASAPGTFDGINLEVGADVTLIGVVSTGTQQRYGLRTLPGVSGLTVMGGNFSGNGVGDMSLSDAAGSRNIVSRGMRAAVAAATDIVVQAFAPGDSQPRLRIGADGDIRMGTGAAAPDVRLYRSGADELRTNDKLVADQGFWIGTRAILSGNGSPEGVVTASVGSIYLRIDGGAGSTFYVKEPGTGSTGWVAK